MQSTTVLDHLVSTWTEKYKTISALYKSHQKRKHKVLIPESTFKDFSQITCCLFCFITNIWPTCILQSFGFETYKYTSLANTSTFLWFHSEVSQNTYTFKVYLALCVLARSLKWHNFDSADLLQEQGHDVPAPRTPGKQ
jgi:hypothetical protein